MIEVRDLEVRFGPVCAVSVPRMDVRAGETLAVSGPNGSGKTTLLRVLAGLIRPTTGRVSGLPERGRTVLVHQEPYFFSGTVRENLVYALRLAGRPAAEAGTWLERAQATHLADRQARNVSVGERRRLAIARALSLCPEVLLLDEPYAGLDPVHRTVIHQELGIFDGTLVLSTPDSNGVDCDRRLELGIFATETVTLRA